MDDFPDYLTSLDESTDIEELDLDKELENDVDFDLVSDMK